MRFSSDGFELEGYLAVPERVPEGGSPGLVVCHGFPTAALGAKGAGKSYHTLADRISSGHGTTVLAMHYRGCGESEGNFSLQGWLRDVQAAIDALAARPDVSAVSVVGFGTGAALAISAAALRPRVRSVAAIAPPADFADWLSDPKQLLDHARRVGAISDDDFPGDFDAWAAELDQVRAVDGAGNLSPRPLMILHGTHDEVVPVFDSRIVADAHGTADLRLIQGAGHLLLYDPRAVAVLLGWVDRQRFSQSV